MATTAGTLSNFIDGERADSGGETEPVLNPASGEELAQAPTSSAEDVDRAVRAARRAFDGWSTTTPAQRSQALLAMAERLEEHGEEIARLEALNAGKPIEAVKSDEIPVMADNLRFFAGAARCLEGRAAGEYMEGYTSYVRREAVGVIGQITPWNYPLMMAIWKIAPALAAGNTVVLKPAETTPVTTVRFAELAADILPKGVLNVITGPGEPTGQALISHPEVDMVSLTGSVRYRQAHRAHGGRHASSACTWSSGARRRCWSSTTWASRARWRRSRAPATTTPGRTARLPRACSPRAASTTTSSPAWPSRRRAS